MQEGGRKIWLRWSGEEAERAVRGLSQGSVAPAWPQLSEGLVL